VVPNHNLSGFQAEVSGFSGPFDLLCYLVENRQLDAAGISVGQAVRIYGAYLANTRRVSVAVVSEFLTLAASLVLNKIRSLLPGKAGGQEDDQSGMEDEPLDGYDVEEKLSRYRPYRKAAFFLWNRKEKQDFVFFRPPPGKKDNPGTSATSTDCAVSGGTFWKKKGPPVLRESSPGWTGKMTGKECLFRCRMRSRST